MNGCVGLLEEQPVLTSCFKAQDRKFSNKESEECQVVNVSIVDLLLHVGN